MASDGLRLLFPGSRLSLMIPKILQRCDHFSNQLFSQPMSFNIFLTHLFIPHITITLLIYWLPACVSLHHGTSSVLHKRHGRHVTNFY